MEQDIYDQMAQDEAAQREAAMAGSLRRLAGTNPDMQAKVLQLSRSSGLPTDVVARNVDAVEVNKRAREMAELAARSPVLSRQLADPGFAALAHDDVESFDSIEQTIGAIASYAMGARKGGGLPEFLSKFPRTLAGALGPGIGAGMYGVAAAPIGVAEQLGSAVVQGLDDLAAAVTGTRRRDMNDGASLEAALLAKQKSSTAVQRAWEGDFSSLSRTEREILSGISSTGQQLPALVAGLLGAPEAATLGFMGLMTGGQSYGKAREAGLDPARALTLALPDAGAEILGEKYLGMMGLLKDLKAGMPLARVFVRDLVRENAGEIPTTLAQNFNEWAVLNPDKSLGEWLSEQPDAIRETIIATTTQTVLMGGAGAVVRKVTDKTAADRWAAQQAEQSGAALERLAQFAAASKTLTRDAQTVREFVAQVADEGDDGATELFIDGDQLQNVLNQSGMSREEFAAVAPRAAEQLGAAAHGGLVTLPMSEFVVLGDKAAPLIDHIRVGEDMPTRAEAREFMGSEEGKQLQGQVEAELQRRERADADQQTTAGLAQRFEKELLAAGRSPTVAKSDAQVRASGYATLAQRAGIPLDDFVREYKLDVVDQELQGSTMTQADTATPEFRNWFADSQAVDKSGKPLIVYHGAPDARFVKEDGIFKTLGEKYGVNEPDKRAFWFTPDRRVANTYADDRRAFDYQNADPGVVDAYLSIKNPLIVDGGGKEWRDAQARGKTSDVIEQARAGGHDGVIIRNVRDDYNNTLRTKPTDTYVVFSSNQIKSASLNRGSYDPNDPSILNQGAPRVITEDEGGAPTYATADITIAFPQDTERFEVIPQEGERVVNYAIMSPTGFESLGFVELLIKDGVATSLLDIEITPAGRRQGAGRKTVEAILAANPTADLNISNIVSSARGFWAKMGVPEQNLPEGEAYDGALNWETYSANQRPTVGAASQGGEASSGGNAETEGGNRSNAGEAGLRDVVALRKRESVLKSLLNCL